MRWNTLKTEEDLNDAIKRLEEIFDNYTDNLSNELLLLSYLIEEYEDKHYAIE